MVWWLDSIHNQEKCGRPIKIRPFWGHRPSFQRLQNVCYSPEVVPRIRFCEGEQIVIGRLAFLSQDSHSCSKVVFWSRLINKICFCDDWWSIRYLHVLVCWLFIVCVYDWLSKHYPLSYFLWVTTFGRRKVGADRAFRRRRSSTIFPGSSGETIPPSLRTPVDRLKCFRCKTYQSFSWLILFWKFSESFYHQKHIASAHWPS